MTQVTAATNLIGPDLSQASSTNDARRYFNNFYSIPFNVSAGANDAILAFFEEKTGNQQSAKSLAAAVLYTAMSQNLDPLEVLSQFETMTSNQLNNYLAAFLNISRVPTSMVGVNNGTKTSPFVSRTILP